MRSNDLTVESSTRRLSLKLFVNVTFWSIDGYLTFIVSLDPLNDYRGLSFIGSIESVRFDFIPLGTRYLSYVEKE